LEEFGMADKFETQLNNAIEEVVKGYKKSARVAANFAAEKTANYIYDCELTCLQMYYDGFRPNSYQRTESLQNSFVKFSNVTPWKHGLICDMGVKFDPDKLDGSYEASGKYRRNEVSDATPLNQWIIDNYLEGRHPKTNGSSISKEAIDSFEYVNTVDTNWWMGERIKSTRHPGKNDAVEQFQTWFYTSLFEQTLKLIK
jgi:hypothetical protein